jgi:hypothetical protein
MQAVWMLLATLGLASAGVLGLALVTQVAAWGEAPMILTAPSSTGPGLGGGAVRAWALKPASQTSLLAVTCRLRTILRVLIT